MKLNFTMDQSKILTAQKVEEIVQLKTENRALTENSANLER